MCGDTHGFIFMEASFIHSPLFLGIDPLLSSLYGLFLCSEVLSDPKDDEAKYAETSCALSTEVDEPV